MTNTTRAEPLRRLVLAVAAATALAAAAIGPAAARTAPPQAHAAAASQTLSARQLSIAPIAAATATGDMPRLNTALHAGLDAGLPALLALGTANQTKLAGAPVTGALFEFAPVVDTYLKTHLFGDIFARDNLDWQSRELATVGALAAMPGVESQLQSHIRFSMNVGLTPAQLRQLADGLAGHGQGEAAARARAALDKQLADASAR